MPPSAATSRRSSIDWATAPCSPASWVESGYFTPKPLLLSMSRRVKNSDPPSLAETALLSIDLDSLLDQCFPSQPILERSPLASKELYPSNPELAHSAADTDLTPRPPTAPVFEARSTASTRLNQLCHSSDTDACLSFPAPPARITSLQGLPPQRKLPPVPPPKDLYSHRKSSLMAAAPVNYVRAHSSSISTLSSESSILSSESSMDSDDSFRWSASSSSTTPSSLSCPSHSANLMDLTALNSPFWMTECSPIEEDTMDYLSIRTGAATPAPSHSRPSSGGSSATDTTITSSSAASSIASTPSRSLRARKSLASLGKMFKGKRASRPPLPEKDWGQSSP